VKNAFLQKKHLHVQIWKPRKSTKTPLPVFFQTIHFVFKKRLLPLRSYFLNITINLFE